MSSLGSTTLPLSFKEHHNDEDEGKRARSTRKYISIIVSRHPPMVLQPNLEVIPNKGYRYARVTFPTRPYPYLHL